MTNLTLPIISEKERRAAVAKATAEAYLKNLDSDSELYAFWRNVEVMDQKAKDEGGKGYYYYSRRVMVDTCYWGENEGQLVLILNAPYVGELPVWNQFIQNHTVYYYVGDDGVTLTWANEDGEPNLSERVLAAIG
jgi:hypothetical protein